MTLFESRFTRRSLGVLTAAALTLTATACGQDTAAPGSSNEKVTIEHAQGSTEVVKDPKKIVVLEFGALDTLNALGLADRVVGLPKGGVVPTALEQFKDKKYADVGTMAEPNVEAINKLKPDLVIVGFRNAKKYPELSKHFPTIDITYEQDGPFYDGVEKASTIIGKAVGKESEVKAKLADLKTAIETAKTKMPQGGKGMMLMTSAGKVTLHGPTSRYGVIHRDLGVAPAISKVSEGSHGDPISFEAIQKANPDVMFVVDRDAAIGESGKAAKQVLDNELVASTKAWKNNKVVYLDGQRWYITIHGLDNAKAMVEETVKGL